MVTIQVHMAEGRTPQQKQALMKAITEAVVEHLGTPRESVRVWISEFPRSDYMAAGKLLAERQPDPPSPA